jgi:hypothetical protein
MSEPRITYAPRPDATAEAQVAALSNVYRFIFDCHARKRGRLLDKSGPDDARKDQDAGTYPHCT